MTAPDTTIATTPRPSFAILVAISAIGPLALNLMIPSMPGLEKTFGVPYGTVQLTLTLYLIGMAVCQLIYGPASDKFGRRPLLLAGLSLFFIASVLAAIAPTIELLIAARLIQAIGGSAGIVLARAMVRDVFTREKSASVISYITMAFVVAPMVAPVLGGFLEQYSNWRTGFWLLAAVGASVLSAAWISLPETHHARGTDPQNFFRNAGSLFAIPKFRAYTFTLGFTSCVFFSFLGGAPHIMMDVLKRTPHGIWPVVPHHLRRLHDRQLPLGPLHPDNWHRPHDPRRLCGHRLRRTPLPRLRHLRPPRPATLVPAHVTRRLRQWPHHSQRHGGRHLG